MEWYLNREIYENATVGEWQFEKGVHHCYTLEDPCRKKKIAGITAIPCGRYKLDLTWSGRFNRELPILVDVPLFFAVRVHGGNSVEDTEACILAGTEKFLDKRGDYEQWHIRNREPALAPIINKLREHIANKTDVYINITGGFTAEEMKNA